MDYIRTLRADSDLAALLREVCDVEILPECRSPEDEFGHLSYNLSGKTFAETGSGSEYLLLEDGSVGFWGSEGSGGRIAENLQEFFELMLSCPYWQDYLKEEKYQDRESLGAFAKETLANLSDSFDGGISLAQARQKLADQLGIAIKADVTDVLLRFYRCAKREPRFISTYTEDDGSRHSGTGCVFDR